MKLYLAVKAKCEECDWEAGVILGRTRGVIWHECNQGNVRNRVPNIKEFIAASKPLRKK